jgi:hypothetical protein
MRSPEDKTNEAELRSKLGIPNDAQRVLVLQESSHWDTNWLRTSDEYFEGRIEPIFRAIFRELDRDPTRVFAVESVYFLKRYFEHHPEHQERLRRHVNSGRVRLIGASLTTPDTVLAHPESLLRDYLLGQSWLDGAGLRVFPRVAYFPDNFGHSPALPSLMRAVAVDGVGITRIDGMHFVGADWRPRGRFPLPGSTAHALLKGHQSLDFVWRDEAGAELLCHWNAFTYFQGDMLGHVGAVRWNGTCFGMRWRFAGHVARQLDRFAAQLSPVSRTPYLFCPIGCDFNAPIEDLGALIRRYNSTRFPRTGTYVVLAALDDYLELVAAHREKLPVLSADPNPAWMGFYASRPELKTLHTRTACKLIAHEVEATRDGTTSSQVDHAWELLALSNHHDFITGTSPDRVVYAEQLPWLLKAAAGAAVNPNAPPLIPHLPRPLPAPVWRWRRGNLEVETRQLSFTLSPQHGGCLTLLQNAAGEPLLKGLGLDLVSYSDSGGLWRLGHEFLGGRFREQTRASEFPAQVQVHVEHGGLRIETRGTLGSVPFQRTLFVNPDAPSLRVRIKVHPPPRTTVTCRMEWNFAPKTLRMDVAGGSTTRPLTKLYSPTFWPALSEVEFGAVRLRPHAPCAVSATPNGVFEWVVARHATKELAFGLLPILAHPIGGSVKEPQHHEAEWLLEPVAPRPVVPWIKVSGADLRVTAVKRAEKGSGLVARLWADVTHPEAARLSLEGDDIEAAAFCDARESSREPLPVLAGVVHVPVRRGISSLWVKRRGV